MQRVLMNILKYVVDGSEGKDFVDYKGDYEVFHVYLCPKCDRVYQLDRLFINATETDKAKFIWVDDYLTDFPRYRLEKRKCKKCEI